MNTHKQSAEIFKNTKSHKRSLKQSLNNALAMRTTIDQEVLNLELLKKYEKLFVLFKH